MLMGETDLDLGKEVERYEFDLETIRSGFDVRLDNNVSAGWTPFR